MVDFTLLSMETLPSGTKFGQDNMPFITVIPVLVSPLHTKLHLWMEKDELDLLFSC
jgi:hypothetical protein